MASAWGSSWGSAWGNSWGTVDGTPPIPPEPPPEPGEVVEGSRQRFIFPDGTRIIGYETVGDENFTEDGSDFSSAAWTREGMLAFGAGSILDIGLAPDGTLSMDRFVEDTSDGYHRFGQGYELPTNGRYKWEIYVKRNTAGSPRNCALQITEGNENYIYQRFNLEGLGELGVLEQGTLGQWWSAGIENLGNVGGSFRVWVEGVANPTRPANGIQGWFYVILPDVPPLTPDNRYVGDGVSGLTVWGARFGALLKP